MPAPGEVIKTDASKTQQIARRAIDELVAALEAGESDRLRAYLAMLARFHQYSWGNVLLIHMQFPTASRIAGYRAWQRLGRQVRRGARAIHILAPVLRKDPQDEDDPGRIVAFRTAHVFDISQTEGEALPEFARVSGDPGHHLDRLKVFVERNGIALSYSDRIGAAEGLSAGGMIILRADMDSAAEFAVLAHETAHEILHQKEVPEESDKTVRETEAEAVAFMVCHAIGLNTNSAAADYIRLYRGNKDTLLASLERIQKTAARIIHGILDQDVPVGRQASGAIVPLPSPRRGPPHQTAGPKVKTWKHKNQSRDFVQVR